MPSLSIAADSPTRDSKFLESESPEGKVEPDFLQTTPTASQIKTTNFDNENSPLVSNNCSTSIEPLGLYSALKTTQIMRMTGESSGTGTRTTTKRTRWTDPLNTRSYCSSREFISFTSSSSICILIILSTFWSTSLGMANNETNVTSSTRRTGSISLSSLPSSTLKSSSSGEENIPSILARPALNQQHHNHQHQYLPSSSVIEGGGGAKDHPHHHHKCYVCLPKDRSSTEAQGILKLFKDEAANIPDCASFNSNNKKNFEFRCPQDHRGCLLRIHGTSVSRSCVKFQLNDCKTANSVELCYCSGHLCNENKSRMSPPPEEIGGSSLETESEEKAKARLLEEKDEAESRKFFTKDETDDEDLLEMQDERGSGDPPGVIDQYTTTPKPTLIPNLRNDPGRAKTTLPPPTASSNTLVPQSTMMIISLIYLLCSALIPNHHQPLVNNRP